jgi:hypothetical protein
LSDKEGNGEEEEAITSKQLSVSVETVERIESHLMEKPKALCSPCEISLRTVGR